MSNEELRILKNTIEQMACDADDKGLPDFGLRLSVADAFTLCKLEPPRRWIPCSERLPDMPGDYQVCTKNEYYGTKNVSKRYFNGVCWSGRWTNITHWMPLPEPPEEEKMGLEDGNGT